jgi:hypothetical protein
MDLEFSPTQELIDEYIFLPADSEHVVWCIYIPEVYKRFRMYNDFTNYLRNDYEEFTSEEKRYINQKIDAYVLTISSGIPTADLSTISVHDDRRAEENFGIVRDEKTGKLDIKIDDLVIDANSLGKGASGIVYKAALRRKQDVIFALKIVQPGKSVQNEINIYNHIHSVCEKKGVRWHPNILKYYGWIPIAADGKSGERIGLVLEYIEGKDFGKKVESFKDKIRVQRNHTMTPIVKKEVLTRLMQFLQLASAVQWLHDVCGVTHRDVKLQNSLIDTNPAHISDGVNRAVLMDFDMAVIKTYSIRGAVGTPNYIAPEILTNSFGIDNIPYTSAVDVWSLYVCLFILCDESGRAPFPGRTRNDVYHNIMRFQHLAVTIPEIADVLRSGFVNPNVRDGLDNLIRKTTMAMNKIERLY